MLNLPLRILPFCLWTEVPKLFVQGQSHRREEHGSRRAKILLSRWQGHWIWMIVIETCSPSSQIWSEIFQSPKEEAALQRPSELLSCTTLCFAFPLTDVNLSRFQACKKGELQRTPSEGSIKSAVPQGVQEPNTRHANVLHRWRTHQPITDTDARVEPFPLGGSWSLRDE